MTTCPKCKSLRTEYREPVSDKTMVFLIVTMALTAFAAPPIFFLIVAFFVITYPRGHICKSCKYHWKGDAK